MKGHSFFCDGKSRATIFRQPAGYFGDLRLMQAEDMIIEKPSADWTR
jgi:hypothetical protein